MIKRGRVDYHIENIARTKTSRKTVFAQATSPNGFSRSSLNAFISAAPSDGEIAVFRHGRANRLTQVAGGILARR